MDFKNKKVLFFSPIFFGYEKVIYDKLSNIFGECVFYDERAKPSNIEKILIRLNLKLFIHKKITGYYNNIINKYTDNYFDYIIFFNPETISEVILKRFKEKQKKAKFILYMWDSFSNKPQTKNIISFFDKKLTFNKEDAINYSLIFRPLFYIDEYKKAKDDEKKSRSIDIGFVGTVHSDRLYLLRNIENWANEHGLKTKFYLYSPSRILYYKYKIENFRKIKVEKKDLNFIPLPANEVKSFIQNCNVIVDIQHPKQTGLTMRTIEMIGMKKKLITTNPDIVNYDFYNKKNICYVDRNNPQIDLSFISSVYEEISEDIYYKYSIDCFISDLLSDDAMSCFERR